MSIAALEQWTFDLALPLWSSVGFDAHESQFVEQISFDGAPMLDVPRRVMVQARQIYVFGLAHERGWFKGGDQLVENAYRQMVSRYGPDAGHGWAFSCDRAGRVLDATRDLYAHAFVLLALATVARLGFGGEPLKLAKETLAFMDEHMSAPAGAYLETLPDSGPMRRQNPHMHLLEALLSWHAIAPDEGFDARAQNLVDLFQRRFLVYARGNVALVEFFDAALAPLGGPDYGFEPGHHFEWVWLLAEHKRLTGWGHAATARALWNTALRFGFRGDGAILDEVSLFGQPLRRGVRLWPLTEALKACRSGFAAPSGVPQRRPDELAATLLATFLDPAPPGLWRDHFDAGGRQTRHDVPASSLYHLCCALSQY